MSGFLPSDLLKEIKVRPGIFNKDALEPPRREHRQQLWLEVAEALTPPDEWKKYSRSKKEARIGEVSNKWKNLRDHFHREVKLVESGQENKKRKYIYFDEMQFVRPYIGYKQPPLKKSKNKTIDSFNSNEEAEENNSDIDMDDFLKAKVPNVKDDKRNVQVLKKKVKTNIQQSSNIRQIKPSISYKKENRRSAQKGDINNFDILTKNNDVKNPSFKIREGDLSFCLSLVPTLRQLYGAQKLSAKIDILKVLHGVLEDIERTEKHSQSGSNTSTSKLNYSKNQSVECDEMEAAEESVIGNKSWWI